MKLNFLFKSIILCWILVAVQNVSKAQTTKEEIFTSPEKFGGVNFAYPYHANKVTPAPKGYHPFYISHFGRHGSRYLTSEDEYFNVLKLFKSAKDSNNLTSLGKGALKRIEKICDSVNGKAGQLTPLGISQIKNIAQRMYKNYPQVFSDGANITAVSTTVGRCVKSMNIFCSQLQQNNKSLIINPNAHESHMQYLNHHTKKAVDFRYSQDTWRKEYNQFVQEHVKPERLLKSLFINFSQLPDSLNATEFMFDLFSIAGNLQNTELNISLFDLFEKEELFNLWQCKNYSLYVQYSNAAVNKGIMMDNAKPLLQDIINKADSAIKTNRHGSSIRFGHDGNIIPLAMLLHIENTYASVTNPLDYYRYWRDFEVAPMAANLQIIFFRNKKSKEILAKFVYNEKEVRIPEVYSNIWPFYRWEDVSSYYSSFINNAVTALGVN
ncbi:MAG: histidine phosphatase family protein [Bacteroidetes bacterium]|nr:histidine phosphatase family protein [Bacteroidota bacterium]